MDYLPVELQTSILKFLLAISRAPDLAHPFLSIADLDSPITRWKWIDDDPRTQSLFPFNAASVCKLWRDILTRIPECWTRVVFDVAQDPGLFLEALLWSKNLEHVEVVVFNSSGLSSDTEELQHELEKKRVFSIIQALSPHILRCQSVEFDVIYSSSLPSPIIFFLQDLPNIEKISLNCRLDDIVVETQSWTTVVDHERILLANSFPKLEMLSLTGFWFMYLALAAGGPQWFQRLELEPPFLYISQFQFLDEGQYTLENFVLCLSMFSCEGYIFRNLSLSYTFDDTKLDCDEQYEISGSIHFISVSHDFQVHLYALSELDVHSDLSFEACQIPEVLQSQYRLGYSLNLRNIDGESIRHILEVWCGDYIEIWSCPSFDDTLLAWLGTKVEFTAPDDDETIKAFYAPSLQIFDIQDCPNITPRAMRDFITARNAAALSGGDCDDGSRRIEALCVNGKVPLLSPEDKEWFVSIANIIRVAWTACSNDGSNDYFTTHRFRRTLTEHD